MMVAAASSEGVGGDHRGMGTRNPLYYAMILQFPFILPLSGLFPPNSPCAGPGQRHPGLASTLPVATCTGTPDVTAPSARHLRCAVWGSGAEPDCTAHPALPPRGGARRAWPPPWCSPPVRARDACCRTGITSGGRPRAPSRPASLRRSGRAAHGRALPLPQYGRHPARSRARRRAPRPCGMAPLTARGPDGCMLGEGDATVAPPGRVLIDPSTRSRRSSPSNRSSGRGC